MLETSLLFSMELYKPIITQFETAEQMYKQVADYFADRALDTIGEVGSFRVAVSGGRTPLPLYKMLSNNPIIPWSNIELFQTDERYVDSNDPESNQFQITSNLTKPVLEDCKEVSFFNTSLTITQTVKEYQDKLETLEQPLFDFMLLGVGVDGHIASLFPDGDYLRHLPDAVLITEAPKNMKLQQRVSLSIETLLKSKEIVVLLVGDEKRHILPEIVEGKLRAVDFPAKFLLSHPQVYFYQTLDNS